MKLTFRGLRKAKVFGPLAHLLHSGATLRELLHATPAHSYSKGVRQVSFIGMNKRPDLWHITYRVWGHEKKSDPRGHLVKLRFLVEPDVDPQDLEVEVSCDCYAFVYWGAQYNVKQMTALERPIKNRDGQIDMSAPEDLGRDYVICKHIAAVVEHCSQLMSKHLKKQFEEKPKPAIKVETEPELTEG